MSGCLVLREANLVDGTRARPCRDVPIVIERDRIVGTGRVGAIHNHDLADTIVDYGTATVVPGLIDPDVHTQFNASRTGGEVVAAHISESTVQLNERR